MILERHKKEERISSIADLRLNYLKDLRKAIKMDFIENPNQQDISKIVLLDLQKINKKNNKQK